MSLQALKMDVRGRKAMAVKRCLFGVDHAANKRQLDALNALFDKRDQDTWDFNFAQGTPVANPKRYSWEPVTDDHVVPVAYRLPVFRRCSTSNPLSESSSSLPCTGGGGSSSPSPSSAGVKTTADSPPSAPVAAAAVSDLVTGEDNVNPTSLGGRPTTTTNTGTPPSTTTPTTPTASPVQSAEQTTCPAFSNSTPSSTLQRKRKRSDSTQSTIPEFFTQRKKQSLTAAKRRLDL